MSGPYSFPAPVVRCRLFPSIFNYFVYTVERLIRPGRLRAWAVRQDGDPDATAPHQAAPRPALSALQYQAAAASGATSALSSERIR